MPGPQATRNGLRTFASLGATLAATLGGTAHAATLTRGPYLQLLNRTSVTIVWDTDVPAACSVAIRPLDGVATTVAGGTDTVCAVPIDGLSPGTAYAYTPQADDVDLRSESVFRTDDPTAPFTFDVVGDSGGAGPPQYAVAGRMLAGPVDFAFHVGDMIYESGAALDFDPQFFRPYADLLRSAVFWPCLGNHDFQTLLGGPWRDAFYLPANNPAATKNYYSFDYGNAHVLMLDSNETTAPGSAQYLFADADLAATTQTWKFVAFHHTIYSGGAHGGNLVIRANLVPLFDAHHVDIVFMGHDHDYERSLPLKANAVVAPGAGTVYVTTGGGGRSLTPVTPVSTTARAEAAFSFTRVSIAGGSLLLQMIRADGSIGDTMQLVKSGTPPVPRCGDDLVDQPGEACDGRDHTACLGACAPDCTCEPVCGDGVVNQPGEACDGSADAACPGLCRTDCTCGDPSEFVTLSPIADTVIEAGTAATWDHGIGQTIAGDTKPETIGYLKFDLSGVPVAVTDATLYLGCTNKAIDRGSIYPVPSSSWIEGTKTGADKTSAGGPGLKWVDVDTNNDAVVDALDASPYVPDWSRAAATVGPVATGQTIAIDVTSLVQDGPGLYTFALRNDSSDGASYASRENTTTALRPRLRLQLGGTLPTTTTTTSSTLPTNTTATTTIASITSTSTTQTTATTTATSSTTSTTVASLTLAGVFQADTFTRQQNPTTNYGTKPTLEVRARAGYLKDTFLRVSVQGVGGRTVTSAHLFLTVKSASGATPGARVHRITSCDWVETAMTWKTQPPIDGPVLASAANLPAGAVADLDVSAAIPGDGVYCFALDGTGNGPVIYASRESPTPPRLVVQVAP